MASFTTIPRELRDSIYSYCDLIVDVEIIPYPTPHERDSTQYQEEKVCYPSGALLRMNRQISTEALEIIFGRNTWRLPSIPLPWVNGHNIFRGRNLKHIRSLTIVFDQHDLPNSLKSSISRMAHSRELHAPIVDVHGQYLKEMVGEWQNKSYLLSKHEKLQSIVVDLGNLACPSGCCRFHLLVMDGPFFKFFLRDLLPSDLARDCAIRKRTVPTVTIKGMLREEEKILMSQVYKFSISED